MARVRASAICCSHHSTAPCVKSTETAQRALRYIGARQRFEQGFASCCCAMVCRGLMQFDPQDPYCEWQINSSKKGDYQCSRRGRLDGSIRDPTGCPKVCNQWVETHFCTTLTTLCISKTFLSTHFLLIPLSSAKGGRRAVNASPTPASVPGVNQPKPASISLPTSRNTLMESAGTGMTGNIALPSLCFQLKISCSVRYRKGIETNSFVFFYFYLF